jgi:hypothetical protein
MVYYLSTLPEAVYNCANCSEACYLLGRGIPIIYKMFAIHIVMATYWLFSSANGPLLWCALS